MQITVELLILLYLVLFIITIEWKKAPKKRRPSWSFTKNTKPGVIAHNYKSRFQYQPGPLHQDPIQK